VAAATLPAPAAATTTGARLTYLVLAPSGQNAAKAADRVAAAGGTVVARYGKIGVLVASSTDPSFASRVAGSGVESVASTDGRGTLLDDVATTEVAAADASAATGDPTAEQEENRV
jgi:hypothetical protein